jgi:hypothetical protein
MKKLPHLDQSGNLAALGIWERGLAPEIERRQRLHKTEFLRISKGGDPPPGYTRELVLAELRGRIRGYGAQLRRIARFTAVNDNQLQQTSQTTDARELIRESKAYEATTGPPPDKRQRRLLLPTVAPYLPRRAKSYFPATSKKYSNLISGASTCRESEDFCAFRGGKYSPNKNNIRARERIP